MSVLYILLYYSFNFKTKCVHNITSMFFFYIFIVKLLETKNVML